MRENRVCSRCFFLFSFLQWLTVLVMTSTASNNSSKQAEADRVGLCDQLCQQLRGGRHHTVAYRHRTAAYRYRRRVGKVLPPLASVLNRSFGSEQELRFRTGASVRPGDSV